MKKLYAILMVMVLCVSLVACGGVDKQPAIDAFNNATTVYDKLVNEINADITAYPQELIDVMMEMSEALLENKAIMESDQELTEEQVAAMVKAFGEVETWAKETDAELENLKNLVAEPEPTATPEPVVDNRQSAIDAFNEAATAYDALVEKVNANPEVYPDYIIELMGTMATPLTNVKQILESGMELADENVQELVASMNEIKAWVYEVERSVGGSTGDVGNVDKQSLVDEFNMIVEPINAYVDEVGRHVDDFDEELVNRLNEYAQFLSECQLVLESDLEITEEDGKSMKHNFEIIWQWVLEVKHDIFG